MRYAVQYEIIDSNPALDMAGALSIPKAVHHPALPPARISELLSRISRYKGRKVTQLAVELNLLTFVRSSELCLARWNEINFERALWEIPAKREPIAGVRYSDRGMKMKGYVGVKCCTSNRPHTSFNKIKGLIRILWRSSMRLRPW